MYTPLSHLNRGRAARRSSPASEDLQFQGTSRDRSAAARGLVEKPYKGWRFRGWRGACNRKTPKCVIEVRKRKSTPADSTAASGTRPMSSRDIRERLEHEAVYAGDSRTKLNALKMLQELNAEPGGSRQSEAARNKQHLSESGYFFGPGSLVIERRSGRFRAFERTRRGPACRAACARTATGGGVSSPTNEVTETS